MTTLVDQAILSVADNRPPMLEKDMYDSWKSIMELYMMNRQHERMILESVENGPLIWPSIEENGVTRPKKYSELSALEAIQADCDVKATNIILQGLPPEERKCKLYDESDKFAYKKRETLYDLDEVYNHDNVNHNLINQAVQAMPFFEQSNIVNQSETEITSDSNIIPYSQYVSESQQAAVHNFNSPAQQDALILYNQSAQTVYMLTKPQFFYDHTTKQALGFQNPFYLKKAQQLEPKLYDGNVIEKTNAIMIRDFEETLMLAKESRSKMFLKQKDPMMSEKKVNTTPADYANSMNSPEPTLSTRPTKVEVPKELPKVSMSQEKDMVIKKLKERIKSLSGNMKEDKIKKELEEIKTINIELDHREKVLVITALKDNIRKLKGKAVVDDVVTSHPIDLEPLKVDVAQLAPKLQNNMTVHSDYLKHTQEETATLREIVEHGRSLNPINTSLDYAYIASVLHFKLNVNYDLQYVTCNSCLFSDNYDSCVLDFINNVNARVKSKSVKKIVKRKVWKPTGKVFTNIGYIWRPNGRIFTIVGNECLLTRITTTAKVPLRKPIAVESNTHKPVVTLVYSRKPKASRNNVPVSKFRHNKSLSANKKEPNKSWGSTVFNVPSSSIDECRVYFMDGLGHKLFSVGQFCDSDLEVAFRQHTCFIRNLKGVDLLSGSQGKNLYTLSLGDMMASSPICLLSKASKTKSWLWHRRLSHLNFGTINHLARQGLVRGLLKLKFKKDHLCLAAMGKSKKKSHKPKSKDTNQKKLYLLHMDLYGSMRVESVNGKKYILIIFDDYSQFTWVKCLRLKDEALDFIIKFLKMIQVRLKVPVRHIRTDNETEFVNQTLREYYEQRQLLPHVTPKIVPSYVFVMARHHMSFYMTNFPTYRTFIVDHPALEVIAPIAEVVALELVTSTGSPSSTTVDQDAPLPSNSQTTPETQSPIILNDVEDDNHNLDVAHMNNDFKWTKDHPLENIIGQLAIPIFTRLQLHEQALFCYYDAFLTSIEPKMYKDALTQSCWIEAMQEELNEFERLEKKARLVAHGYRQEEGINFEESFTSVARLEAIRIFLAYATHKNMVVYQMDVKTAFLNSSVDPTLFIRREDNDLLWNKSMLMCSKFKMSMMGKISLFLGLQISQSPRGIFINQSKYALESLKKYGFESCDPLDTPMVEKSKLDEDKERKYARYQAWPIEKHLHAVKRIFWYLRGTVNRGLWYPKDSSIALTAFADADHVGCQDIRHSTSGIMSKHIDIRYHFIKKYVENGVIGLYFVNTEYQLAYIFTKALGRERIEFLINKLGMRSFTPETATIDI
nr:integrase, catalytic region, zinc finger, CCHC-type, peptidase aspartic, catalytic [Tanacetum cinerariifolium]